jgi:hypothetical protein
MQGTGKRGGDAGLFKVSYYPDIPLELEMSLLYSVFGSCVWALLTLQLPFRRYSTVQTTVLYCKGHVIPH